MDASGVESKPKKPERPALRNVVLIFAGLTALGPVSLLVRAGAELSRGADWSSALTVVSAGLVLCGGAALVGSVIGFLFGVPRRGAPTANTSSGYLPNTNLEQLSDWLTKIIVGIGLVQFPRIVAFFVSIGTVAGPSLGNGADGKTIAIALVVHYLLVGFFAGFLVAYLWLPVAFDFWLAAAFERAKKIEKQRSHGSAKHDQEAGPDAKPRSEDVSVPEQQH